MEDLNEKWKEGKLPDGEYFCKTSLGAIDIFKCGENCSLREYSKAGKGCSTCVAGLAEQALAKIKEIK